MKVFPVVVGSIVVASLVAPLVARAELAPGSRDPFRPFLAGIPLSASTNPIERFAVDEMHVEGIISGIAAPRALVRTPDGTTTDVGVGTTIGNRGGHVAQITRDALVVVERVDEKSERELIIGLAPDAP